MKTISTLIQAGLLAGAAVYFLPYLWQGVREMARDIKREGER
jgi:hypothetical protein